MPRKSTICHRGDIFVAQKTMRCRREFNAVYGHSSVMPFLILNYNDNYVFAQNVAYDKIHRLVFHSQIVGYNSFSDYEQSRSQDERDKTLVVISRPYCGF